MRNLKQHFLRRPLWDTGIPSDPDTSSFCFRQWGCQTSYDTAKQVLRVQPVQPLLGISFFFSLLLSLFHFHFDSFRDQTVVRRECGYRLTFAVYRDRWSIFHIQLRCNARASMEYNVGGFQRVIEGLLHPLNPLRKETNRDNCGNYEALRDDPWC